ncbi:metallophosphoesterase family protein [Streptomyces sp. BH-SS-21]|uniref:Metallophosphoesterase family protein n=1 Tax=Streptomyces liliiviolaceus TaxID=2823109 RepID=A0A941B7W0_9ACTN|nr:metallophosphoesterase family protein [Streptomyces liliiviolaceus]MBQ0848383.1 metallophosphoesterase family protein [Streptomyces liliiviolaceus]
MPCCLAAPHALLRALHSAARRGTAQARHLHDPDPDPDHAPDAVSAVNLELVTLTEDRAVITWHTGVAGSDDGFGRMLPAVTEGEVVYGTHPAHLNRTAAEDRDTAHHYVELTDLEPGQTYYYQARSRGSAATPTPLHLVKGNAVGTSLHGFGTHAGPYSFTTPQPPPGRHLLSIALCNDLHLGETTAGLVTGMPLMRGISQRLGLGPYPEIMGRALVEEAHRRGARLLLAAGDISAGGAPRDLSEARRLLDGFGTHGQDYFVVRGNHDRRGRQGLHEEGGDNFLDAFPASDGGSGDGPAYFARDLGGLRVLGLDTYEKRGNGAGSGGLSDEQLAWFRADVRAHKDQPTVVFGHHPLTVRNSPFPVTSGQRLNRRQARAILDAYAAAPGVFLHHAGHTHRNKRTLLPQARHVTLQEVGAVKEYPGGFCLLRIHTGGYALNYYKTSSAPAREWSERSRRVAAGLWPQYALGRSVRDRNSVTPRDLSGITPAAARISAAQG